MISFFRTLKRIAGMISAYAFTLLKYRKISKQYKNDKDGFVKASMQLSQDAMKRVKDTGGVEIAFNGAAIHDGPTIYVANHMSFMDAPIIGSVVKTSFVSKRETGSQPLVGPMLRAMSTTFIDRTSEDLPRARSELIRKLNDGRNMMFFPEATTTDGSFILPFRAGLLQTLFNKEAEAKTGDHLPENFKLQALTIRLTHVNGINIEDNRAETQHLRDIFTNHLRTPSGTFNEMMHTVKYMGKVKSARVEVTAHEALSPSDFEDGKALINAAREQVLSAVEGTVDPNIELWEEYRVGRPGWKPAKQELMDAMKPTPIAKPKLTA